MKYLIKYPGSVANGKLVFVDASENGKLPRYSLDMDILVTFADSGNQAFYRKKYLVSYYDNLRIYLNKI